jgi:CO/xanthine dehydrogenase Mo-binding subunit
VPDRSITLASIGKKGNLYMSKIAPVLGVANPAFTQQAPGFAAQLARIEVDPDTGESRCTTSWCVQDVGRPSIRSGSRARCRAAPSRAWAWR